MKLSPTSNFVEKPSRAHSTDAGWDLHLPVDVDLVEDSIEMVDLQLKVAVPDGHFGMIVPRSSMGKRRILLANTIGIVDSGYRGNIQVALLYKPSIDMPLTTHLKRGDRIVQLIIVPYSNVNLLMVDSLEDTDRGEGGFGSTGE